MSSDLVEDKIKKHYCVDGNEWLVEKGKVKEAHLLKEAYHRILSLRKDVTMYASWYHHELQAHRKLENSIIKRETDVEKKEKMLSDKMTRLMEFLECNGPKGQDDEPNK